MKQCIFILFLIVSGNLYAQDSIRRFSLEVGIAGNIYEFGEKGASVSDGLTFRLNSKFKISLDFGLAYGYYRYSRNQFEPSFVETRTISLQMPILYNLPGKLSFLSLGLGPSLNFRSRFQNDSFKLYTTAGTTKIYRYEYGYMFNTLFTGMTAKLEAIIYQKKRLSFTIFSTCNVYYNPFKIDYYGAGIKTSVKL